MNWNTIALRTIALLSLALMAVPAYAANGGGCPAFNAGMVDAAMLTADLSQIDPLEGFAEDSPMDGTIACGWVADGDGAFIVEVGNGEAQVIGLAPTPGDGETGKLRTAVFDLTPAEQHACRAQVLRSFVWQQYCKPLMQ